MNSPLEKCKSIPITSTALGHILHLNTYLKLKLSGNWMNIQKTVIKHAQLHSTIYMYHIEKTNVQIQSFIYSAILYPDINIPG